MEDGLYKKVHSTGLIRAAGKRNKSKNTAIIRIAVIKVISEEGS
jgi:hypothetical protein